MPRAGDDAADASLSARLVRSILSDDRLSSRLGGWAEEAALEAASEAPPRFGQGGTGGGPESSLPEALLMTIFDMLDVTDVCRSSSTCVRWRQAATSESLWRRLCRRQLAQFHPTWGPLGTSPPKGAAVDEAYVGEVNEGYLASVTVGGGAADAAAAAPPPPDRDFFFILPPPPVDRPLLVAADGDARVAVHPPEPFLELQLPRAPWHVAEDEAQAASGGSAPGPAARAERAATQSFLARAVAARCAWIGGSAVAAQDSYIRARNCLVAEFRTAVAAARSFRAAFVTLSGVRFDGFYSIRHQYIRSGIEDRFHKIDGLLIVVYHRALRFFPDGTAVYVMTAGRLADVARQLSRVCSGASPARGANVGLGRYALLGSDVRVTVALTQTDSVQHWHLAVRSDLPQGLFHRLSVANMVTCSTGAPYTSGYSLPELADSEFGFTSVREWNGV